MPSVNRLIVSQTVSDVLKSLSQEYTDLYFGSDVIGRKVAEKLGLIPFSIPSRYIKDSLEHLVDKGIATKVMYYRERGGKVYTISIYRFIL